MNRGAWWPTAHRPELDTAEQLKTHSNLVSCGASPSNDEHLSWS